MTFAQPEYLYALAAILPLLALFFWWSEVRLRRQLEGFAAAPLLATLAASASPVRRLWKMGLVFFAVLLAVVAAARPQWGATIEERDGRGLDLMFVLDASLSMLVEDVRPNRLERARLAILDLVDRIPGDRVGLIAFAGTAFLQSPLTLDHESFRRALMAVDTDTLPVPGTDIGYAILTAREALRDDRNHRVIILISDGEDLEARGLREAREAVSDGFLIFTVGVGTAEPQRIPVIGPDGRRTYHRDPSGEIVETRFDETTLMEIAAATSGSYLNLAGAGSLERIYERIVEIVPPEDLGSHFQEVLIERYQGFLAAAVLLLVVERLLGTRRRLPAVRPALAVAGVLILLQPPDLAGSALEGRRLFQAGEYAASAEAYARALERRPDNATLLYNKGVSLYRSGQLEAAQAAFSRALELGGADVQERSFFNLGNTLFEKGRQALAEGDTPAAWDLWGEAVDAFENALELDANAADAARNAELVRRNLVPLGRTVEVGAIPAQGGETTPSGRLVLPRGANLPLQARAASGWRFDGWVGEGIEDPEAERTTLFVSEDTLAGARFVRTWQLDVVSGNPEWGTAGESGRFDEGAEVPIKAEARPRYAFSRWTGDGLEIADRGSAETTVRLSQDARVVAEFVDAFELTVRIEPETGGFAGDSGYFEVFSNPRIFAEPRPGYAWRGWEGRGVADPSAQETTVALTEDREVIAQMGRIWSLVLIPVPEEGGFVEGGGDHDIGARVPIQAEPADGFRFVGWEGEGVEDPEAPATHVRVRSREHTLYARFEQEDGDDDGEGGDSEDSEDSEDSDDSDPSEDSDDSDPSEDSDDPSDESDPSDPEDPSPPEPEPEPADEEEGEPPPPPPAAELSPEEIDQILNLMGTDERVLPVITDEERRAAERVIGRDW